jgi:hypothetical protein
MLEETVFGNKGIPVAFDIINHLQQLTLSQSIILQMETSTEIRHGYWIHCFFDLDCMDNSNLIKYDITEIRASCHTHKHFQK